MGVVRASAIGDERIFVATAEHELLDQSSDKPRRGAMISAGFRIVDRSSQLVLEPSSAAEA